MGAGKWIGGILGFMTMGPLGALAGFALGSLLDGNNGLFGNTYEKGQAEAGNYDEGQRNSFLFSMLVMASYTSSVQTDASCTAKWNMYANS